jgi:hypothetical protein
MIRAGIVFLVLAAVALIYTAAQDGQPVRVPLDLAADGTVTARWTPPRDGTINVIVDLKRNLPFEELLAI